MHQNCPDCARLWNEFALATRHYLKVEGNLQFAGMSHDQKLIDELTPCFHKAAETRAALRREIEAHEGHHHHLRADAASA